jgi:hypothetical protein
MTVAVRWPGWLNWLLARALVHEIRQAQPNVLLNTVVYTREMDGQGFVNQAIQAARSPNVVVRANLELAGRLTSTGQFNAATALLQPLVNSVAADHGRLGAYRDRADTSRLAALSACTTALTGIYGAPWKRVSDISQ